MLINPSRLTHAMLCGLSLCLSTGMAAASEVPVQQQPGQTPPVWGPDVFGGYSTSHIIVLAKPGVTPQQLADGRWTFRTSAMAAAGVDQSTEALAAALQRRGAMNVRPAISFTPANAALASKHRLDRYYTIQLPQGSDTPAIVNELAAFNDHFEAVMVDVIGGIAGGPVFPNDPQFAQQWNMHNVGQNGGTPDADVDAPDCWGIHQGAVETIVAVLDTGVQHADPDAPGSVNHPDLVGRVISGWDFNDGNGDTNDYQGHGTHCAGTIAANANNGIGIAGLNWHAKILAVKVVNDLGSGSATTCADGIVYATDNGAHVISMSLQYYNLSAGHPLQSAVNYAWDSGVLPVAATGNFALAGTVAYPAKYPNCMGVGGTTKFDTKYVGSNTGPEVDIAAPGDQVYSLRNNSSYDTMSGTSMATPHVAAVASLIRSYNPALTIAEIEDILKSTADDLGPAGWDSTFGWGRLNAHAALLAAAPAPCPADITGEGQVNVADLLAVINAWGSCPAPPLPCIADIAGGTSGGGDGVVNVTDLLSVINAWGACP